MAEMKGWQTMGRDSYGQVRPADTDRSSRPRLESSHWHVATGLQGYGPESDEFGFPTFEDSDDGLIELVDEVHRILDEFSEWEFESADALGESGQFEDAWKTRKHSDELDTLARNWSNDRRSAPAYAGDPALWSDWVRSNLDAFPIDVSFNTRLYVWDCVEVDCLVDDDEVDR